MYSFRIKPGSKLEGFIDSILKNGTDGVSKKGLKDSYDVDWRLIDTLFVMGQNADNFTCDRRGVSYVDVVPQTIVEHASVEGPTAQAGDPVAQINWPDVPMIADVSDYEWFRKPAWYDRMAVMVDAGKHISLAGPPGIGKSSAVEYLAAERGKVLVNVGGEAGFRKRDLTGNTELINGHTRFDVAEYAAAAVNGWWVKVDEVNAAEADALMFLNAQLAPPYSVNFYGKSFPVHKDFRVFVTYNPGLVGTKPLPDSFKDRFFPIKLQFPNKAQLRRMLEANGMPSDAMQEGMTIVSSGNNWTSSGDSWTNAIVEFGTRAWESHTMGRMRYQITPRRLMDAVTLVTLCDEYVFDALEAAVISAVDNIAETRVLKEILKALKQEMEYGRI